jgi:integrase
MACARPIEESAELDVMNGHKQECDAVFQQVQSLRGLTPTIQAALNESPKLTGPAAGIPGIRIDVAHATLRKGELTSLSIAQLRLDGSIPHFELDAEDEKNREGNGVVIRADLAADLERWLAGKLADLQAEARRRGEPIPARLPPDTPIFTVPTGLIRIFDRDLRAADIPKRDERGRTLDVYALRTTFGTLLSRGGVALRTAQAAMRHSDPSLTANVYTDPKLLDVVGALDALPSLPLDGGPNAD